MVVIPSKMGFINKRFLLWRLQRLGLASRAELARLRALRGSIKKNGAIWVVWPKGRKELREDDVRAQGKAAGLVDVKVMSFSDTLSGLKLVIPVKER